MSRNDEDLKIEETSTELDRKASSMSSLWEELPDELWKEIFNRVDGGHSDGHRGGLEHVSLVCKRFLALSNTTRTSFFISQQHKTVPMAPLLSRFTHIKRISFWGPDSNLDISITQLAKSNLPLQCLELLNQIRLPAKGMRLLGSITRLANSNLPLQCLELLNQIRLPAKGMRLLGPNMKKTLRSLICTEFRFMCDRDLALVADCFPYLRKLDIEGSMNEGNNKFNKVTDNGIFVIATKLKSLVSLNILYHEGLSHRSFEYLAANSSQLRKLSADFYGYNCRTCVNGFLSFKCLTSLKLSGEKISKSVLVKLSGIQSKLEKLCLEYSEITSDIDGVFFCWFLKSLRFLRSLKLGLDFPFPSDMKGKDFALSLPNIQVIELLSCSRTHSSIPFGSLFYLLHSCPLLERIAVACYYLHIHVPDLSKMPTHRHMIHLSFNLCEDLLDEVLMLIVSVCPNLKSLVIASCSGFTKEGIEAVITKFSNLKHVTVSSCRNVPDIQVIKNVR